MNRIYVRVFGFLLLAVAAVQLIVNGHAVWVAVLAAGLAAIWLGREWSVRMDYRKGTRHLVPRLPFGVTDSRCVFLSVVHEMGNSKKAWLQFKLRVGEYLQRANVVFHIDDEQLELPELRFNPEGIHLMKGFKRYAHCDLVWNSGIQAIVDKLLVSERAVVRVTSEDNVHEFVLRRSDRDRMKKAIQKYQELANAPVGE